MKEQIRVGDLGEKKAEELLGEWIEATGSGELTQDVKPIEVSMKDRSDFIGIVGQALAGYEDLSRGKTGIILRQDEEIQKINELLRGGNKFSIPNTHLYLEKVLNHFDELMDWINKFIDNPTNDNIIFKMREVAERLASMFPIRGWGGNLYRCPECLSMVDTTDIRLEKIGYTCKKCHLVFYVDRKEPELKS